ncbi:hypothetical protein BT96DRAFT_922360 [Gymnopus androsaceus JB14]|uniref:Uncharacterized protein n=1 Tax=Gymnopus androsaceus JB14 TaxID=1447944 RepID=A0A6A4HFW9_9AGAR|nr:hypothetical protein BT96DRAFT_922360 [Gymnopus androsaceus JB14]
MSNAEVKYRKARLAVLQHASTQHLVDQDEESIEEWAKVFSFNKALYDRTMEILGNTGKRFPDTDNRVKDAFEVGDAFVLARADITWTGKWVDPRWKKAALDRAEEEKMKREKLVFDAQKIEKTVNSELDALFDIGIDEFDFGFSDSADESNTRVQPISTSSNHEKHVTLLPTPTRQPSSISLGKRKEDSDIPRDETTPARGSSASVKRARSEIFEPVEQGASTSRVSKSGNEAATSHILYGTSKGVPVALPFDYRALSSVAQAILVVGKPSIGMSALETLKYSFQTGRSLQVNKAFVEEMSEVLPKCAHCTISNKKSCVWIADRAQCKACHNQKKCSFGDTLKWMKACSWLPDKEPEDLRKLVGTISISYAGKVVTPDPFWYEKGTGAMSLSSTKPSSSSSYSGSSSSGSSSSGSSSLSSD